MLQIGLGDQLLGVPLHTARQDSNSSATPRLPSKVYASLDFHGKKSA